MVQLLLVVFMHLLTHLHLILMHKMGIPHLSVPLLRVEYVQSSRLCQV